MRTLQGGEPGRLNFAQRRVYGRYIAELINPHLGAPGEPGRLQVIYGEGRSISIAPSGVRLSIDDGRCFAGDVARAAQPVMTRRRAAVQAATSIRGKVPQLPTSTAMPLC